MIHLDQCPSGAIKISGKIRGRVSFSSSLSQFPIASLVLVCSGQLAVLFSGHKVHEDHSEREQDLLQKL